MAGGSKPNPGSEPFDSSHGRGRKGGGGKTQRHADPGRPSPTKPNRDETLSLVLVALVCALQIVAMGGLFDMGLRPANAQWWGDDRNPYYGGQRTRQPRAPQPGFGFPFFEWGAPTYQPPPERQIERRRRETVRPAPVDRPPTADRPATADFSKAPPAKKPDAESAKKVLALGDSMADWLGYGLEDAFDGSEFGVIRKARAGSGLIRNEPREHDWLQEAREALASEKADYVVMMLGLSDRHSMRERPPARNPAPAQPLSIRPGDAPNAEQPNAAAPEAEQQGGAVTHEFRSEKWVELYSKRIDDVIAVLKSKRVPVFWVGLPPIRGARSRAELSFLNDLYKSRAEKAGITYVDVWEGFVDDSGEFSNYGPDVMGQVRRLRAGDGVHFTKAGARKLAHYVDREIRRLLSRETPVALPIPDFREKAPAALTAPSGPAPRPVAGPVVPLTGGTPETGALLGSRGSDAQLPDPIAAKVLLKGEPLPPAPGRADNFTWPRPQATSENDVAEPPSEAIAPRPAAPARPAARVKAGQKPGTSAEATSPRPRSSDSQAGSAQGRSVR